MTNNLLKKGLGQVGSFGKQIGKGIVEEAKKAKSATKQQAGIEQVDNTTAKAIEKLDSSEKKKIESIKNEETKQFVMGFYAKTDDKSKPVNTQQNQAMIKMAEEKPERKPEDIQKEAQLLNLLHNEYYRQLTRPKPEQLEERPAEKVEKEKKEDEMEFQKKEEKKTKKVALPQTHSVEKAKGAIG